MKKPYDPENGPEIKRILADARKEADRRIRRGLIHPGCSEFSLTYKIGGQWVDFHFEVYGEGCIRLTR